MCAGVGRVREWTDVHRTKSRHILLHFLQSIPLQVCHCQFDLGRPLVCNLFSFSSILSLDYKMTEKLFL